MNKKKKIIGSIVILVIFTIFLITGYILSRPSKDLNTKEVFNDATVVESKDNKDMTIYINGEVKKPGVYKLKSGSRVQDLLNSAGGFNETADKTKLNLAKKLKDEDYIYVDKQNDKNPSASSGSNANSNVASDGKVNINTATKEQLKTVSGIGDVTAQKIIDYREKNGSFNSIEDLKKVGRIGDKSLEKIKDKIEVR
ncbi:helix-hairpin-helix domain-containing protein [Clostridium scatologenes]|uniref:Competence protein ComEA helix-hairpin-helix repeat protein n=1 Tax=Clostridium scatologenes TaxID=1548 RepID=A0A0E3JS69_CLOSL|nr:helix-hairpin-helix domain-containing protein [Clostridium scatologenes]AKA72110.1 competence protein ComEA helix-hairpin-helix repeat protein [Clostridium scatologenes]